jgi:hypothetical protein
MHESLCRRDIGSREGHRDFVHDVSRGRIDVSQNVSQFDALQYIFEAAVALVRSLTFERVSSGGA